MKPIQVLGNRVLLEAIFEYQEGWPGLVIDHIRYCQSIRIKFFGMGKPYQVHVDGKMYRSIDICLEEPKGPAFAFHMAIVFGEDEVAKCIASLHPEVMTTLASECASRFGRVDILDMIARNGCRISRRAMKKAAEYNHLDTVAYLINECKMPCTARAIKKAAGHGYLKLLKYIDGICPEIDWSGTIKYAALGGHLDVVKFLCDGRDEKCTGAAFRSAILAGRLDILKYLEKRFPDAEDMMEEWEVSYAALDGNKDILDHLWRKLPGHFDESTTTYACQKGNLAAVNKLMKKYDPEPDTLSVLIDKWDNLPTPLDEAKYHRGLIFSPYRINRDQLKTSPKLEANYLKIIKKLQKIGFQTSPKLFDAAAEHGCLTIVDHLHCQTDEVCTKKAMNKAANRGHFDIVKYLHHNRMEGCTIKAMDKAAKNGHLDIVQFLHKHRTEGCTTAAMNEAAANGHFEVVKFLHTHRTEGCTTDAMDNAARNGHLDIVKFLYCSRTEGCTTEALNRAATNWHVDVVKFLLENGINHCTKTALRTGNKEIRRLLKDAIVDEDAEEDPYDEFFYSTGSE